MRRYWVGLTLCSLLTAGVGLHAVFAAISLGRREWDLTIESLASAALLGACIVYTVMNLAGLRPRPLFRVLTWLDSVPRYGRVYIRQHYRKSVDGRPDYTTPWTTHWLFRREGCWGLSLAERFHAEGYLDYLRKRGLVQECEMIIPLEEDI